MNVWEFIQEKLFDGINVTLLYVLESEGSSPGRKGFKMAVAADSSFCGTIGGGVMEYKLVEKAKDLIAKNENHVILKRQYHDKDKSNDRSGMICSGSQLNAFVPLTVTDKKNILDIFTARRKTIQLSPSGISLISGTAKGLQYNSDEDWTYTEALNNRPLIHIIGGGHVSLALSEILSFLDFYIKVYDDRPGLHSLLQNNFADEKIIIPGYEKLLEFFETCENDYVVIMTVGYRTDKIVLKQLIGKEFFYLGLLGSQTKKETLFAELKAEGVSDALLNKVFSPIGINISSKTSKEIAVSIAAEITRQKNKDL